METEQLQKELMFSKGNISKLDKENELLRENVYQLRQEIQEITKKNK